MVVASLDVVWFSATETEILTMKKTLSLVIVSALVLTSVAFAQDKKDKMGGMDKKPAMMGKMKGHAMMGGHKMMKGHAMHKGHMGKKDGMMKKDGDMKMGAMKKKS